MLHAVIHGKLGLDRPESMRTEDGLTSAVFGTLLAAGATDVLAEWLWQAHGDRGGLSPVAYWFWPRLSRAEPDVVLRIGSRLLVVEAKLASGKHNAGGDRRWSDDENSSTRDQLCREWDSVDPAQSREHAAYPPALAEGCRDCRKLVVMVVDRRRWRQADTEVRESVALRPEADFALTSWQGLYQILNRRANRGEAHGWQADLIAFLSACELDGFTGIQERWRAGVSCASVLKSWSVPSTQPGSEAIGDWKNAVEPVSRLGPSRVTETTSTLLVEEANSHRAPCTRRHSHE